MEKSVHNTHAHSHSHVLNETQTNTQINEFFYCHWCVSVVCPMSLIRSWMCQMDDAQYTRTFLLVASITDVNVLYAILIVCMKSITHRTWAIGMHYHCKHHLLWWFCACAVHAVEVYILLILHLNENSNFKFQTCCSASFLDWNRLRR